MSPEGGAVATWWRQTWAILLDTYRELSTKKLFWVTLALSGLVVVAMAAVGINQKGLTLLHWQFGSFDGMLTSDTFPPDRLYKAIFVNMGVGTWLAWIALILALVSTCGLIPDMISSGAIETTLSKPISRTHLYLTKFAGGLIFGGLQVGVFCVASFLVIGLRGGSWEPAIFLAIPIVILLNSYLLCVCMLVGLISRSAIVALIATLLFWFFLFITNMSDGILLQQRELAKMRVERAQSRLTTVEERLAKATDATREAMAKEVETRRSRLAESGDDLASMTRWARIPVYSKAVLPKTSETVELLKRRIATGLDVEPNENSAEGGGDLSMQMMSPGERRELTKRIEAALQERSVAWVLGTSVVFVGVVLAVSCVVFRRRDF